MLREKKTLNINKRMISYTDYVNYIVRPFNNFSNKK